MKKRPLGIPFTEEERTLLKRVADRDFRDETSEVRWVVRAYAEGKLISANSVNRVPIESDRPITAVATEETASDLKDDQKRLASQDVKKSKSRLRKS